LAHVGGHARAPAKSRKLGAYDSGRLATCRVPMDPTSPAPTRGMSWHAWRSMSEDLVCLHIYFATCCCSFYGLELHHLTPSGILHIAAFVTLCEAYMGIESHIDLWNYFFQAWLPLGSDAKLAVWGSMDISVQSGLGVDPYFCLSMSNPPVG
jgi:hypothetical protein